MYSVTERRQEEYTPYKKKATGERDKTATTGKKIESTRGYVTLSRTIDEKKKDYTTRLLSPLETKIGITTVINDQLTYDSVGRVSSFNNISYSYDELGRLISADDGNNKWTYSYGSIGNIISSSS